MKIYAILGVGYEGDGVKAVYSTKEKALEALPYLASCFDEGDIEEYDIDPPNEGEKYEKFYYFNIFSNGESFRGETYEKPSEVKWINYGRFDRYTALYQGYGRTPEEAKINAEKARDSSQPVWQISDDGIEVHHSHPSTIFEWRGFSREGACYAVHADRNVCIIALEEYKKFGKISEFLTVTK